MKKNLLALLLSVCFMAIVIFACEMAVRAFMPRVNFQDTSMSLYKENAIGNSFGWVPNATGISFGESVSIDERGFRSNPFEPTASDETWLFIGDSVTFGVGVKAERIFTDLIQKDVRENDIKVINSAVVGYFAGNYVDVIKNIDRIDPNVTRVFLCFTLNDAYTNINIKPDNPTVLSKVRAFLRSHSKLYLVLKNLLADRSRKYFLYDQSLYKAPSEALDKLGASFSEIQALLQEKNIELAVFVFPYEYQLRRPDDDGISLPQTELMTMLAEKNIQAVDLTEYFEAASIKSSDLYLYGDAMHLSVLGHEAAHKAISDFLKQEAEGKSP